MTSHVRAAAGVVRLPMDCRVEYHPSFLSPDECRDGYAWLDGIAALKDRRFRLTGGAEQLVDTGRYMLADPELLDYQHLPQVWGGREAWPAWLAPIRRRVDAAAGETFHVCRCIWYASGEFGADFHQDYPAYGSTAVIASISLGDEREFAFRRKDDPDDQHRLVLASGSLLVMGEGCQDLYEHALPPAGAGRPPRFNLTFRRYGW